MEMALSIIPLLIGIYLAYYILKMAFRDRELDAWPKINGVIIKSMVTCEEKRGRNGNRSNIYGHFIEYKYEIEGIIYTGNRIGLIEKSSGYESYARHSVDRYPEGKYIDVYYNPNETEECYLEKDISIIIYVIFILTSLFCIITGIVIFFVGDEIFTKIGDQ